jgi:hypothetical protein
MAADFVLGAISMEGPPSCSWVMMKDPWEAFPTDDLLQHCKGVSCACHPAYNDEDVLLHNAFDRREDYETGKRRVA